VVQHRCPHEAPESMAGQNLLTMTVTRRVGRSCYHTRTARSDPADSVPCNGSLARAHRQTSCSGRIHSSCDEGDKCSSVCRCGAHTPPHSL